MKKIVVIFATLVGVGSSVYADIPLAVSTKASSSCEIQSNGNPIPITSCIEQEVELIEKYINYNLSNAPASKKKEWQRFQKKIAKKCNYENNDPSDAFNEFGYYGCIRDEYSQFNRKLLNTKDLSIKGEVNEQ